MGWHWFSRPVQSFLMTESQPAAVSLQRELCREHEPPGRGSQCLLSHSLLFLHGNKKHWRGWQETRTSCAHLALAGVGSQSSALSPCVWCTHCQEELGSVWVGFKPLTYPACARGFLLAPSYSPDLLFSISFCKNWKLWPHPHHLNTSLLPQQFWAEGWEHSLSPGP